MFGMLDLDYGLLFKNKQNEKQNKNEKSEKVKIKKIGMILTNPSNYFLDRIQRNYVDKVYKFSQKILLSVYEFYINQSQDGKIKQDIKNTKDRKNKKNKKNGKDRKNGKEGIICERKKIK